MPWASRAWSKSTPPAAPASASSTLRAMISCAKARSCSPSTTAPGRRTLRRCSPRSPRTVPKRSSSRSAYMPPTSPASSSKWPQPGTPSAHTRGVTRICRKPRVGNVNRKVQTVEYNPKDEIEMGISAVHWAVGGPTAPYFRFPALRQPPELIEYLGKRNIAIFSTDMDSFGFKMRKPEQVRQSVMEKLKKHGKGIVLVHDFQHATAEAAMD